jgi:hypothetical protein
VHDVRVRPLAAGRQMHFAIVGERSDTGYAIQLCTCR